MISKKFSLILLCVFCVGAGLWLATSHAESQTSKEDPAQSFCGSSKRIEFGLKDENHTKFSIPEAYLYDPYGLYYLPSRSKDPIDFISIQINKHNGQPNCRYETEDRSRFTAVNIEASDMESFGRNFRSVKRMYPYEIGIDSLFNIYRNSDVAVNSESRDLLIPSDQKLKNKIFLECVYSFNDEALKKPERTGCKVYSLISDSVYLKYSIKPEDLHDYASINATIKDRVMEFENGEN